MPGRLRLLSCTAEWLRRDYLKNTEELWAAFHKMGATPHHLHHLYRCHLTMVRISALIPVNPDGGRSPVRIVGATGRHP
jgi:hypothetical protein